MQIFIKTLAGKTYVKKVRIDTTVKELKMMIETDEFIPADSQRLLFSGKQLE